MAEYQAPDTIRVFAAPFESPSFHELVFDKGHTLEITGDGELVLPVPFTDFHFINSDWIQARWTYGAGNRNEVTIMFPAGSGVGRELIQRRLVRAPGRRRTAF
jgi:hypothetical protein